MSTAAIDVPLDRLTRKWCHVRAGTAVDAGGTGRDVSKFLSLVAGRNDVNR